MTLVLYMCYIVQNVCNGVVMSEIVRFGVSTMKDLLDKFDATIRKRNYPTRSKAIEDLMREAVVQNELSNDNSAIVGSIELIYNHHKRELLNKITDMQHDYQDIILSSQHVHLSHGSCYEIIVVRGEKRKAEMFAAKIKAIKGVRHGYLRLMKEE